MSNGIKLQLDCNPILLKTVMQILGEISYLRGGQEKMEA